ncbi:hypothetical protein WJ542_13095 [Paraburkholderia sp. B3]|uniref:hypothetical protein n=1 Tax=Paraburkholderia sp. B3 TaxID=3134791 RepID=UPI0039826085
MLFPSPCHGVLAVKGCAPLALASSRPKNKAAMLVKGAVPKPVDASQEAQAIAGRPSIGQIAA